MLNFPIPRAVVIVGALILAVCFSVVAQDNLTVQEILDRHLRSFGSADAIGKSQKRMAVGRSDFTPFDTGKSGTGQAKFASDGKDMAFFSIFDLWNYSAEKIGIFSNKATIPKVDNGRSPLGSFLFAYDQTLTGRLFGGSIFSTWLFLGSDLNGMTAEAGGKKKVNGADAWMIKVVPKGGLTAGSYIKLYFDAKEFHHIRTVYFQKGIDQGFFDVGSPSNSPMTTSTSGLRGEPTYNDTTLTEDFSDYRSDACGIALPHKYDLHLEADTPTSRGSAQFVWHFQISGYTLTSDPPSKLFSF